MKDEPKVFRPRKGERRKSDRRWMGNIFPQNVPFDRRKGERRIGERRKKS